MSAYVDALKLLGGLEKVISPDDDGLLTRTQNALRDLCVEFAEQESLVESLRAGLAQMERRYVRAHEALCDAGEILGDVIVPERTFDVPASVQRLTIKANALETVVKDVRRVLADNCEIIAAEGGGPENLAMSVAIVCSRRRRNEDALAGVERELTEANAAYAGALAELNEALGNVPHKTMVSAIAYVRTEVKDRIKAERRLEHEIQKNAELLDAIKWERVAHERRRVAIDSAVRLASGCMCTENDDSDVFYNAGVKAVVAALEKAGYD